MRNLPSDHEERMRRARLALDGLSVGDAFGEQFFSPASAGSFLKQRKLPHPPWRYTDDTAMALGIAEVLGQYGQIGQDMLARVFAARYRHEPWRGYGSMAHRILAEIGSGGSWRIASWKPFGGTGSMGNGSVMRVAPVGAYFADDFDAVAANAKASAEITHAHPEGTAGAVAVAVAAAGAWRHCHEPAPSGTYDVIRLALDYTPPGDTRAGIERVLALPSDASVETAVRILGNGSRVTCPDTVPFTLWCAGRNLGNYAEALWTTVSAGGDRDTNCAIVGGIVALGAGPGAIPAGWLQAREPLGP